MTSILFPVGRLVWGSMTKPQVLDYEGKPLVVKSGPNAGQPTQSYEFGVAYPKAEQYWQLTTWGAVIWAEGIAFFRNREAERPDFSWKITDGDSNVLTKGMTSPPCTKEGYPGHWIVKFKSSFPPKLFQNKGTLVLQDPEGIKCGYYVEVYGSVEANKLTSNPGVYINHEIVNLAGFGAEISTGTDAKSVGFGGALPAGASSIPVGGFTPPAPAAYAPPAPAAYAPPAPAAYAPPAPAAYAPPAPAAYAPPGVQPIPSFLIGPQ